MSAKRVSNCCSTAVGRIRISRVRSLSNCCGNAVLPIGTICAITQICCSIFFWWRTRGKIIAYIMHWWALPKNAKVCSRQYNARRRIIKSAPIKSSNVWYNCSNGVDAHMKCFSPITKCRINGRRRAIGCAKSSIVVSQATSTATVRGHSQPWPRYRQPPPMRTPTATCSNDRCLLKIHCSWRANCARMR